MSDNMNNKRTQWNNVKGSGRYEIRLNGHVERQWMNMFDTMDIEHTSDGFTVLHFDVIGQAALHGMRRKIRDLGLILFSIKRVGSHSKDNPTSETVNSHEGSGKCPHY